MPSYKRPKITRVALPHPAVGELKAALIRAIEIHHPGQLARNKTVGEDLEAEAKSRMLEQSKTRYVLEQDSSEIKNGSSTILRIRVEPKGGDDSYIGLTVRLRPPSRLSKLFKRDKALPQPEIRVYDPALENVAMHLRDLHSPSVGLNSLNGALFVKQNNHHDLILESLRPYLPNPEKLMLTLYPLSENRPSKFIDITDSETILISKRDYRRENIFEFALPLLPFSQSVESHSPDGFHTWKKIKIIEGSAGNEFEQEFNENIHKKDLARVRLVVKRDKATHLVGHEIEVYSPKLLDWAKELAEKLPKWYGANHSVEVKDLTHMRPTGGN